jgi:hypothetical protein
MNQRTTAEVIRAFDAAVARFGIARDADLPDRGYV